MERGTYRAWPDFASKALVSAILIVSAGCAATDVSDERETLLLVRLQDGTVIQQTVHVDADICFKTNGVSTTTCLTRGDPILGGSGGSVIGYEMTRRQVELIPR